MKKDQRLRRNHRVLLLFFLLYFIICKGFVGHALQLNFTEEERDYIDRATIIKAVTIDGGAPLHYKNSQGEIVGIAIEVLDEIAKMAGLSIEYYLYDSIDELLAGDGDIIMGVSKEYAPPGLIVSKPYMHTEAILFYNSDLDLDRLSAARYVGIEGSILPEGIDKKNVLYFNSREETLEAVEKGVGDYGIGNAYSLTFYLLQNGYKNIITIPTGREERSYCFGVWEKDRILNSIIDRCLETIDENRIETLILKVASQIERKLTLAHIFDVYGPGIIGIVLLIIIVLSVSVVSSLRSAKRLRLQNIRYETLSSVSNELLFEYNVGSKDVQLSEKSAELFDSSEERKELGKPLFESLHGVSHSNSLKNIFNINLSFSSGRQRVFRVIASHIYDEKGALYSSIGKLVDISEEVAERERLISKSQLDGLTGLYNATTSKELISAGIGKKSLDIKDAFIIIDCDNFKEINDTYGHLTGNIALKDISASLRFVFRKTDIIGRIGGDEFCVYMHNISSADLVRQKCLELKNLVKEGNRDYKVRISIGIAITNGENTYEGLFKKADDALYLAKKKGGDNIIVYGEQA